MSVAKHKEEAANKTSLNGTYLGYFYVGNPIEKVFHEAVRKHNEGISKDQDKSWNAPLSFTSSRITSVASSGS